jgi:hypothetical protein
MKYLDVNLLKYVQGLYEQNHKMLMEELNE